MPLISKHEEKTSRLVLTLGIKQQQELGSFWISSYSPIHPWMRQLFMPGHPALEMACSLIAFLACSP
jgi:hypothetical protein